MPTMPPSSYRTGRSAAKLDLSGRQLDGSTVMYLPKSERVNFRLEVYRGGQSSSDSTDFSLPTGRQPPPQGPARAIVEQARPSPFEHTTPEIVVTQTRPAPVLPVSGTVTTTEQAAPEPPKESRLDRFISKIPLFRRLRKHPPADETQPRLVTSAGCARG